VTLTLGTRVASADPRWFPPGVVAVARGPTAARLDLQYGPRVDAVESSDAAGRLAIVLLQAHGLRRIECGRRRIRGMS